MRGQFSQMPLLMLNNWALARTGYPQIGLQARGTHRARFCTSKPSARSARAITITNASRHAQNISSPSSRFPLTTSFTRFVSTIMSAGPVAPAIDAKALATATDIHVFNKKGGKVRFGDIFADQKTIVVFTRAYDATPAAKRAYIHP